MVEITPSYASVLLGGNTDNRKVRMSWVKELTRRIDEGEWVTTHQGILLNFNGKLLDGQHRLMAIVRAEKPVTMPVFYTDDENIYKVLDQGQKRTIGDLTGYSNQVTGPIKFLINLVGGNKSQSVFLVEKVLQSEVGENLSLIDSMPKSRARIYSSAPIRAAAAMSMIASPENKEYILGLYKNMSMLNFESMPPIALSFVRQVETGAVKRSGGQAGQKENFMRAMVLFDYNQKNRKMVKLSKAYQNECRKLVEETILPIIDEGY